MTWPPALLLHHLRRVHKGEGRVGPHLGMILWNDLRSKFLSFILFFCPPPPDIYHSSHSTILPLCFLCSGGIWAVPVVDTNDSFPPLGPASCWRTRETWVWRHSWVQQSFWPLIHTWSFNQHVLTKSHCYITVLCAGRQGYGVKKKNKVFLMSPHSGGERNKLQSRVSSYGDKRCHEIKWSS